MSELTIFSHVWMIPGLNQYRVATQYPFQIPWLFTDFSLTFNRFPDPFGRPILAIFIHRLSEDFAQIFELADLIFKEKS